jgi:hypothetical protein
LPAERVADRPEITDEDHGRTRLHRRRGEPDRQCAAVQPRDNPPAAARQVAVGKQHQQVEVLVLIHDRERLESDSLLPRRSLVALP